MTADATVPPCCSATAEGFLLRVLVVPGASRDEIKGLHGDRLRVRVAAAPEDGRANRAVVELITRLAGRGGRVELVSGATHREKTLLLAGWRTLPPSFAAIR